MLDELRTDDDFAGILPHAAPYPLTGPGPSEQHNIQPDGTGIVVRESQLELDEIILKKLKKIEIEKYDSVKVK